jgi:type III restriction enzyme
LVRGGEGTVVWLVPSDTILEQTLANFKNPDHPYRQQLVKDFPAGVEVYSKDQLLNGQNFQNAASVQAHLSVLVLSYDSFRTKNKDGRRAFRENGRLQDFPVSDNLPEGADETSLVNAINVLNPIVIVDESHHAAGDLSVEMLKNFNPRFILDLTATPRQNSNIIVFVQASDLKKANMVKLPLIVYNRANKHDVLSDAIQLRAKIEQQAVAEEQSGGIYIRPIVLFQAQPKGKEDAATFQKLKDELVKGGIPREQIAVKTADVNELRGVNLLSRDCEIRYIITVNALKEGWDCPFAYILATLANKTSTVDVEQIVGRILRQPYAVEHNQPLLNNSFALTCSVDFANTLDGILKALNSAGFSKKDMRVAEEAPAASVPTIPIIPSVQETLPLDDVPEFLDDYKDVIADALADKPSPSIDDMVAKAVEQTKEYEEETTEAEELGVSSGVEGTMKNQYIMNTKFCAAAEAIQLPQFCFHTEADLFHTENYAKLNRENLSQGFKLDNADSNVSFALSGGDMYAVDAEDAGAKYRKMTAGESEYVRTQMERLPDEGKRRFCIDMITTQIERRKPAGDVLQKSDIAGYVERVIKKLSNDELATLQTGSQFYAGRIHAKIMELFEVYAEKQFVAQTETREILCRPLFALPKTITPFETLTGLEKSLYESEAAVNGTERKVIEEIAALENVLWWHRISERKPYSFYINGFINHYPDFLVMTKSGTLVVVEVKGDDRDNSDSERKLRLGRKWADMAGDGYRYYMVFDNLSWQKEGAYDLSAFVELLGRM